MQKIGTFAFKTKVSNYIHKKKDMSTENNLFLVFTGSQIDASFIKNILEEEGIQSIIHNAFHQSLMAGWVENSASSESQVMVKGKDFIPANNLVEKYLNSRAD